MVIDISTNTNYIYTAWILFYTLIFMMFNIHILYNLEHLFDNISQACYNNYEVIFKFEQQSSASNNEPIVTVDLTSDDVDEPNDNDSIIIDLTLEGDDVILLFD